MSGHENGVSNGVNNGVNGVNGAHGGGTTTPQLDPAAMYGGARLVILGGTGFLGKVFWCMLLDRYPTLGKLFMLVRSNAVQTSEQRFWAQIATSEALQPLRDRHGEGFEAFLRDKIVPVDGDMGLPNCGIAPAVIAELRGTIDAVVNV